MKIIGIIPARGGSKGVPGKNIKSLAGKPLLGYTAERALASNLLSKVILTTEDEGIAAVGKSLGLEVPFLRPAHLALDSSPTLPVIQHVLDYYRSTAYFRDGSIYLTKSSVVSQGSLYGNRLAFLENDPANYINIDTLEDWKAAEDWLELNVNYK